MVRSALFVSLLATLSGAIARSSGHGSKIVPGAYIFEFEDSQVSLARPLTPGDMSTAVAMLTGLHPGHGRLLQETQRRGLDAPQVRLQAVQGCLRPAQGPRQP